MWSCDDLIDPYGIHRGSCYGYDDWGGPNRSGWAEKSSAALRRERQANDLFDSFLERCASLDPDDASPFPVAEEVVKANTHLTGACYTSFRKRVLAKGCKVKRREATAEERKASGDKRSGKLYVISVTCPRHPSKAAEAKRKADEAAATKKKRAREAAERKAEEERRERAERERLTKLRRAKVRDTYNDIVGCIDDGGRERKETPKAKSTGTMDAYVKIDAFAVLNHARGRHNQRTSEAEAAIREEESDLMTKLRARHREEENELRGRMAAKRAESRKEADEEHERIQAKINAAFADGKSKNRNAVATNFVTPCGKRQA